MVDDDDVDEYGADDSKKSERKRQREKQRRSDIASAFDELSSLLSQIDPDESEAVPNRRRRRKPGDVAEPETDASGLTRLDLIGRTAEVLRKLQRENTELRKRLEEQQNQLQNHDQKRGEAVDDKDVLVMVPTLSPLEPDHIVSRGPIYAGEYYYPPTLPVDYRPQLLPQEYYSGRVPPQPLGYPHYQPHPQHQHGWSGHPHPPPPTSLSVPPVPPQRIQYTPSGHPSPHPIRLQNQYSSHPPSPPSRPQSHLFSSAPDPNSERR